MRPRSGATRGVPKRRPGAGVVLTEQDRSVIEQAASAHVATVRRLGFDALIPQEADAMAGVIEKVLADWRAAEEPA